MVILISKPSPQPLSRERERGFPLLPLAGEGGERSEPDEGFFP
jgi:hypothetical protein